MPFRIHRQQASRCIERRLVTDAGEDIEDFALILCGVVHATRGQQRQVQRAGDADGRTVAMLFLTVEVALQLDVDISRAEDAYQPLDALLRGVISTMRERSGQRSLTATRQTDQSLADTPQSRW